MNYGQFCIEHRIIGNRLVTFVNTTLTANVIDRLTNVVSSLMSLLLLSILLLYVCVQVVP